MKTDVNVPLKSKKQKKLIHLFGILRATDEKSRIRSVSQWYGSLDPDPDTDPYQMSPIHDTAASIAAVERFFSQGKNILMMTSND